MFGYQTQICVADETCQSRDTCQMSHATIGPAIGSAVASISSSRHESGDFRILHQRLILW